jgi:NodT family efflux transporter outer membrane factor (OMF) lipoprotein
MSQPTLKAFCRVFPAALALALAAGCNFAPKYTVPAVTAPPAFKETNGWKTAQPSDGAIKGQWWEMFNDARLNELERQVAVSNQNIVAALENFLAARAVAKQARSQLFPTVSAEPAVTATKLSANGGSTIASSSRASPSTIFQSYTLPLDASWEPDLWGSIRNTARASTYAAQASAAQLENLRLTLQSELAVDYYQLRAQDELIALYADTIKNYRDSLELTKTLFETGIDSDLDVAQADTLLETTLAQATALGIQRAQYEHAIALLVGRPASLFSLEADTNSFHAPSVPLLLPAQLLERRPDIAAAERTVAEANANIGVARAAYFPTLSLTGGTGFQSSELSKLLDASSFYWAVGAAASETILDFGRRKAATEQAWATYRSGVAAYREAVLTAVQQIEDNLAALRILADEIQQEDIAVRASQKNYDLAFERYRLGLNSYLNVITAQVSLLSNQQTAVTLHLQQMTATVQLIMALGGGWDPSVLPGPKRVLHGPAPAP